MLIHRRASLFAVTVLFACGVVACSSDDARDSAALGASPSLAVKTAASEPEPPPGLASVTVAGQSLTVWPYTGTDFGTASDPLNLVFAGKADALRIRAALLALDGDRSAFGFPPVPPFNQTWSDGMGGVQTAYAEDGGWLGSVIQLQLGNYGPVRFHLRLFDTRAPFGDDGTWTLGGCHIEVLIPGTADHQVICWEFAEQIVMVDMVRSGLLGANPTQSGNINPAPGYRDIPPPIYNGIPDALKIACGLPPGPSPVPVPIPTDGKATLFLLAGDAGIDTEASEQQFTLEYNQIIPRPFCSGGPLDFLLVQGPVLLSKDVLIGHDGRYEYGAQIRGQLTVTPVDVTQSPPVPTGESFLVSASDVQHGLLSSNDARVSMQSNRLVFQDQVEKQFIHLVIHERGMDSYREQVQCLTD